MSTTSPIRVLKNPGPEIPKVLAFDEIPDPREFLLHGGVPGVEYLYLLASEQPRAQGDGWSPIVGMPYFTVLGHGCTIMARGKPITGTAVAPGDVRCHFYLSDELASALKVVELEPTPAEPGVPQAEPPTPKQALPKPTKTPAEALQVRS